MIQISNNFSTEYSNKNETISKQHTREIVIIEVEKNINLPHKQNTLYLT